MTCAKAVACLLCLVLLGGFVFTQTPAGDRGAGVHIKPPATLKMEKKPFRITLAIKGILAPAETAPISYRPHVLVPPPPSQGPVTIRTIAAHGAEVLQGDVLAEFDTTKIDEVIADLARDMQTQEAALKLAEEEQPLLEKSVPVELAAASTAKDRADEDFEVFPRRRQGADAQASRLHGEDGEVLQGICRGRAAPAREDVQGQRSDRRNRTDDPPPCPESPRDGGVLVADDAPRPRSHPQVDHPQSRKIVDGEPAQAGSGPRQGAEDAGIGGGSETRGALEAALRPRQEPVAHGEAHAGPRRHDHPRSDCRDRLLRQIP